MIIEKAFREGLAAHNEGNVQEAERLYRTILQAQPAHPDANHNLGVIAVSVNKAASALPFFKMALDANPKIEQFWLSYIDALIKEQQFDAVEQVIEQAKEQGMDAEKLHSLRAQLVSTHQARNADSAIPSQKKLNDLLKYYKNRQYVEAETLAISVTEQFPKHQFGWKVLGAVLGQTGRNFEAVSANQTAVTLSPQDAAAHNNLGNTLKEVGRLDEAEASCRQAIALKFDYAEAHNNLGNALKEAGRLKEAEASYRQAIELKPDIAESHSNLGNIFKEVGRLDEAEASCRQAIALKFDYAEAHNNLGNALKEAGKLKEAEASYRQAVVLKPDYAEAHINLGLILQECDRLDEAQAAYAHAIALKPNYALAHFNLGKALYANGCKDLALASIEKARNIGPSNQDFELLFSVIKSRKLREEIETAAFDKNRISEFIRLTSQPLIFNRAVEPELIATLYGMKSSLEKKLRKDARYDTRSSDFNLFEEANLIIKKLSKGLKRIMMEAVKSDIYVYDSFFNILSAGGGTTPHTHINLLDKNIALGLGKQKYSLVYYLSVGDQSCSEPGILKLYDNSENILPCKGMIVVIPASWKHSAVYNGKTDRVMIGVNFYSL